MKCPNCGATVSKQDERCPHCNFNLKKFQTEFFTDKNRPRVEKTSQEGRRTNYHSEVKPKKQNDTIAAMIQWIRVNSTIVFLVGVGLLVLMSFSRSLGWFTFLALMVWLFVVCDRHPNTQQYTADQRLTEKVNQVGSDVMNTFEDKHEKINAKRVEHGKEPLAEKVNTVVKEKRTATQLAVILMAIIDLLVVFNGPFASNSAATYPGQSISKMLLSLGGLGGKYALFGYGIWLILIIFPIAMIILTVKNNAHNKQVVFLLSLTEMVILIIVAINLIFFKSGSLVTFTTPHLAGAKAQQLMTNLISFGISSYLLLISSILTTWIAYKSMRNKKIA